MYTRVRFVVATWGLVLLFGGCSPDDGRPTEAAWNYVIRDAAGAIVRMARENPDTGEIEFRDHDEPAARWFVGFEGETAYFDFIPYGVHRRKGNRTFTIKNGRHGGVVIVHRGASANVANLDPCDGGGWRIRAHRAGAGPEKQLGFLVPASDGWEIQNERTQEVTTVRLQGGVIEIGRGDDLLFTCEGFEEPAIAAIWALRLGNDERMGLIAWFLRKGVE